MQQQDQNFSQPDEENSSISWYSYIQMRPLGSIQLSSHNSSILSEEQLQEQLNEQPKKQVKEEVKEQAKEQIKQECPICFNTYDQKGYAPMLICQKNQHICCKDCIPKIFVKQTVKCPICRSQINKKDVTLFRIYGEYLQTVSVLASKLKEETSQRQVSAKFYDSVLNQKIDLQNQFSCFKQRSSQALDKLRTVCEYRQQQISRLNQQILQKIELQTATNNELNLRLEQEEQHKQIIKSLTLKTENMQAILQLKKHEITQYSDKIKELQEKVEWLESKIQELNLQYNTSDAEKLHRIMNEQQTNRLLSKEIQLLKNRMSQQNVGHNNHVSNILGLNDKQLWQERGHMFLKKGKPQVACDIFMNIIESNIEEQFEIYGIGSVQDIKGYYQNREEQLYFELMKNKMMKVNPYDALGLCFLKTKAFHNAKKWYERMLQTKPQSYQLLFGLANSLYNLSQYSQAEKVYRKIMSLRGDFDKPYQLIASIYYNLGSTQKNSQVMILCKDSLQIRPNNIYSQFMLSALEENQFNKEIQLLNICKKIPSFVRAKSALASHYIALKSMEKGLQLSKECIAANPFYDRPYLNIGYFYESQQMNDLAIDEYNKCIEKNPQSEGAYLSLAKLYLKLGKFDKAIKNVQTSLQINSNFVRGYEMLAKIYFQKGDLHRCIQCFQKCASFNYQKDKYYESIADLYYFNVNNYKKAKQYYDKCRSYNPQNKHALSQLVTIDYQYPKKLLNSHFN